MLLGWNHLLFIDGVLLYTSDRASSDNADAVRPGTQRHPVAGHSRVGASTPAWSTLSWRRARSTPVRGPRRPNGGWRRFSAGLFAFRLVHGLGLATRRQEAVSPDHLNVWRILAFNAGVELAQIFAATGMAVAGLAMSVGLRDRFRPPAPARTAGGHLATIGVPACRSWSRRDGRPGAVHRHARIGSSDRFGPRVGEPCFREGARTRYIEGGTDRGVVSVDQLDRLPLPGDRTTDHPARRRILAAEAVDPGRTARSLGGGAGVMVGQDPPRRCRAAWLLRCRP
jgi:hypothetical protein